MGRISKIKRDLIMESNKRLLNETETGPDLSTCDWFLMDVTFLDGKKGELHLTQEELGKWRIEKFSNKNDWTDFTEDSIEVPQESEIEVYWDKDKERIELVGKSLDGLDAYNKILRENNDKYSGKLIYASEQSPSKYGLNRNYQYLQFTKVQLVESSQLPPWKTDEVKMENGAILNDSSYFVKKELFGKPTYYFITLNDETEYSDLIKPCDKFYGEH
jgi:hypothetical protein